jgi:hypothetical protein
VVGAVGIAGLTTGVRFLTGAHVVPAISNLGPAISNPVAADEIKPSVPGRKALGFRPREMIDASGFWLVMSNLDPWTPTATLENVRDSFRNTAIRLRAWCDDQVAAARQAHDPRAVCDALVNKALFLNSEGDADAAYRALEEARATTLEDDTLATEKMTTLFYLQGVTALRRGENENCILCRGESSCILPLAPAAIHANPLGSQLAIRHFTEVLDRFPDDLEVSWLLNLAHMTLGEYPAKVNPRFLIALDRFKDSEFQVGRFRDVGALVKVNLFNQAGSGVFEDFDNDGLLDLAVSSFDPAQPLSIYRNQGDGTMAERSRAAGVDDQLGGMFCVQTDFNNDGKIDLFIARGAWLPFPVRPSLLRNDGDGKFTDVTIQAGLAAPTNSNSATWADYDNDGWLDLFVCCELEHNRLYHNKGDGTFEEVGARAGLPGPGSPLGCCKGASWIDVDNDDDPDLFMNYRLGPAELYRNNGNGTFTNATRAMKVDGPREGFSCWSWDYDNDGWLDLFATCYDRSLKEVVKGLIGQPHRRGSNRLFRNRDGQYFEDVTREAGLDLVFATMGSNFADFDNDGFLDMYLGTGEPNIATLIPNRMFKNVAGLRFAEVTAASGTGHLQKGHGVSCGDWDRDGDIDLFVQTGGVVKGDRAHNVLFQNPGDRNHWLKLKLVGKKTNRAALGVRIHAVTAGPGIQPLSIHRHITTGSSFGANPLEQTIGLADATKLARLEIHWPTSGQTQVFHDVAADQSIEIVEFATSYTRLESKPIALPASPTINNRSGPVLDGRSQ